LDRSFIARIVQRAEDAQGAYYDCLQTFFQHCVKSPIHTDTVMLQHIFELASPRLWMTLPPSIETRFSEFYTSSPALGDLFLYQRPMTAIVKNVSVKRNSIVKKNNVRAGRTALSIIIKHDPRPITAEKSHIVDTLRHQDMTFDTALWNHILINVQVPQGHWLERVRHRFHELQRIVKEMLPRDVAMIIVDMC
jgi:hypothetical protein